MSMDRRNELVQELRAMADLNRSRTPQLEGPNATLLDCMKCGAMGCNLIEANE